MTEWHTSVEREGYRVGRSGHRLSRPVSHQYCSVLHALMISIRFQSSGIASVSEIQTWRRYKVRISIREEEIEELVTYLFILNGAFSSMNILANWSKLTGKDSETTAIIFSFDFFSSSLKLKRSSLVPSSLSTNVRSGTAPSLQEKDDSALILSSSDSTGDDPAFCPPRISLSAFSSCISSELMDSPISMLWLELLDDARELEMPRGERENMLESVWDAGTRIGPADVMDRAPGVDTDVAGRITQVLEWLWRGETDSKGVGGGVDRADGGRECVFFLNMLFSSPLPLALPLPLPFSKWGGEAIPLTVLDPREFIEETESERSIRPVSLSLSLSLSFSFSFVTLLVI